MAKPNKAENEKRWARFVADPDYDQVVELVRQVLNAAGLDRSTVGERWGLTVLVDKETYLRVNCADYALFDIRDPDLPLQDRQFALATLPEKSTFFGRLFGAVRGRGFEDLVPGSVVRFGRVSSLPKLLAREDIRQGIRRHVEARPRRVFETRHNESAESILDEA